MTMSDLELMQELPNVRTRGAQYPFAERLADWLRFRQGDEAAKRRLSARLSLTAKTKASLTGMARDEDVPVVFTEVESKGEFLLAFEIYWRSALFTEVERLLNQGRLRIKAVEDAKMWLALVERIDPSTGKPSDAQTASSPAR